MMNMHATIMIVVTLRVLRRIVNTLRNIIGIVYYECRVQMLDSEDAEIY